MLDLKKREKIKGTRLISTKSGVFHAYPTQMHLLLWSMHAP